MENPKSYNVGVIGAGWIAKAHMGFLQKTGRAWISWIAARNPGNLEKVRSDFGVPNKTLDDPEIIFYYLDEAGKAREKSIVSECHEEEDGFYLSRHFIDVLDGREQPVITLEKAKKHMEIICQCRKVADLAKNLETIREKT